MDWILKMDRRNHQGTLKSVPARQNFIQHPAHNLSRPA